CRSIQSEKWCLHPLAPARRVFSRHNLSLMSLCRFPQWQSPFQERPSACAAILLCRQNLPVARRRYAQGSTVQWRRDNATDFVSVNARWSLGGSSGDACLHQPLESCTSAHGIGDRQPETLTFFGEQTFCGICVQMGGVETDTGAAD